MLRPIFVRRLLIMQTKSSPEARLEVQAKIEKSDEPPFDPFWMAVVALALSIISFCRTVLSDRKASKHKVGQDFENKFGGEIRDRTRNLERSIKTLRAFSFPSGRDLKADINELQEKKIEWFDSVDELLSILREVDQCVDLKEPHWCDAFRAYSDEAEVTINGVSETKVTTDFALNSNASDAHSKYTSGIVMIRNRLTDQTQLLSSVKLKKRRN